MLSVILSTGLGILGPISFISGPRSLWGWVCPGGEYVWRVGWVPNTLLTPRGTHHTNGRQAGGMYPTWMLSCFNKCICYLLMIENTIPHRPSLLRAGQNFLMSSKESKFAVFYLFCRCQFWLAFQFNQYFCTLLPFNHCHIAEMQVKHNI